MLWHNQLAKRSQRFHCGLVSEKTKHRDSLRPESNGGVHRANDLETLQKTASKRDLLIVRNW